MANKTGKKFGGREAGTPNRVNKEIRHLIKDFVAQNWENVQNDFDNLDAKDRLHFFEKILHYTVPKMQAVSYDIDLKGKLDALNDDELDKLIDQIRNL